jgi:hypothetical protein
MVHDEKSNSNTGFTTCSSIPGSPRHINRSGPEPLIGNIIQISPPSETIQHILPKSFDAGRTALQFWRLRVLDRFDVTSLPNPEFLRKRDDSVATMSRSLCRWTKLRLLQFPRTPRLCLQLQAGVCLCPIHLARKIPRFTIRQRDGGRILWIETEAAQRGESYSDSVYQRKRPRVCLRKSP